MNTFNPTRWILFIGIFLILSTSACEDDEINEASEAFRNCLGSSEATMYQRVGEEKEEDRPKKMCSILDRLYTGCKLQKSALEKCKSAAPTSVHQHKEKHNFSLKMPLKTQHMSKRTLKNSTIL